MSLKLGTALKIILSHWSRSSKSRGNRNKLNLRSRALAQLGKLQKDIFVCTLIRASIAHPDSIRNINSFHADNEFPKYEMCEKWDFQIVNFVKNDISKLWILWKKEFLKLWILWKIRFLNCEFCEKNKILKLWIFSEMRVWILSFLWIIRFWKHDFCNQRFRKYEILEMC